MKLKRKIRERLGNEKLVLVKGKINDKRKKRKLKLETEKKIVGKEKRKETRRNI